MAKLTLMQILRKSGLFERKSGIIKALKEGRISVEGKVTKNMNFQCNPNTREVCLDYVKVELPALRYFIINKPQAYSCQRGDKYKDVRELIPLGVLGEGEPAKRAWNTLFAVGRLDIPTTGLLIITNDGAFGSKVLEPKDKVAKKYRILTKKRFDTEQAEMLSMGVEIEVYDDTYMTKPAHVEILRDHEIFLTIREGKYRQVRKMIGAVRNRCMALERVAIGGLELSKFELAQGEYYEFSGSEIKELVFGKK